MLLMLLKLLVYPNELAVNILPEIKLFTFKGIGWKSFNSKKPRANPTVKSTPDAVFGPCPFTLEITSSFITCCIQ